MRSKNMSISGQIQNYSNDVVMTVGLKGASGSQVALGVRKTYDCVVKLNNLLANKKDSSKLYKLKFANLSYECMLLGIYDSENAKMLNPNVLKYEKIVEELFSETCEQMSEQEMKIRLCYVGNNLRRSLKSADDLYALGILNEGLRRYPDNYGYIRLLIYCLRSQKSIEMC